MPAEQNKYSRETVTWISAVSPKLFRFRTTRPASFRFTAGQWARLGVEKPHAASPTWRAYSIASATYDEQLEFYSIVVPNGEFTSTLATLRVGDTVLVEKQAYGFLTTARFQTSARLPTNAVSNATSQIDSASGNDLWLLSTGTGLAPFVSILQELEVWSSYERIIVVHGVRHSAELAYAQEIAALSTHEILAEFSSSGFSSAQQGKSEKKLHYLACISREKISLEKVGAMAGEPSIENAHTALHGRISDLILNGQLERHLGISLEPIRSRVMICGNPQMVDDTRSILKTRGMTVSRSAAPGQIAVENYW